MRDMKKTISIFITLNLILIMFTSCSVSFTQETKNESTTVLVQKNTTKIIFDAFNERDFDTITKYAPEYIFNMTAEKKEKEYLDGSFSEHAEYESYHDSIVWMYLLSLLENSEELSAKNIFVNEFLKCEDYFMQPSPDCYFQMTSVLGAFADTSDEYRLVAEALSMVLLKSENILDIIPAISAFYGNLDLIYENQYYVNMSIVLNDYRLIVSEEAKNEQKTKIAEYYHSVLSEGDGKTELTKDDMLLFLDEIDDSYDVDMILNEVGGNVICRKDVCLMYCENEEYRIVFYGFPVKLIGVENILTGEVVSSLLLEDGNNQDNQASLL